ncbi:hypothetical protein EJV47_08410 [Hymenobacter gummosus]|uniref:Uncharacterized protein n=1 Tax=Hymenobacter gummosus TaxID=1776032 RepID=A0A3S0IPF8_9BACT|nr:hypothetical protein [Hymenobacter gummosus]RTQ50647.1 hypothetical protein EJV47_08410 [Hymenobacter gummosus]
MKSWFIPANLLAAALLSVGCQHDSAVVRPVAGAPAVTAVSYHPAATTTRADADARTAERLAYAEDLLRHKNTRQLPSHLRRRRYQSLKQLHAYRTAAQFPVLPAYSGQRQPCLRDAEGRVDALGYLMQQSGSPALLEQLSRQYPGTRIETIKDAGLKHWVQMSGLTLEECALIQGVN